MRAQLSLKHLLDGRSKQAGEDPVFAKEVVQVGCAGELVLDALKRRQCWQRWKRIFSIRRLRLIVVSTCLSFGWHGDVLSFASIGG